MADTTPIKNDIEPYIRSWLSARLGVGQLQEANVELLGGSTFKFDAVSNDEAIIACFLSNRSKTGNSNENSGGVRKALNDVHSLKLVPHECRRMLVFTDQAFCDLIRRRSARYNPENIEFLVCKLPSRLQRVLNKVLDCARREQMK